MITLTTVSLLLAFPLSSKQLPSSEQTEIPPILENSLTEETMESFDLQPDEPETETPEGLQDAFEPSSGDIFIRSSPKK